MLRGTFVFIVGLAVTAAAWAEGPPLLEPYSSYPLAQEAQSSAVGDLNGDGRHDVAVAAWPSAVYVLLQDSSRNLDPPLQLAAPYMPLGLVVADLNGDGLEDLVVGGSNGQIWLYYQHENGTLGLPVICSAYGMINSVALSDLNGDGRIDIVAAAGYGASGYSLVLILLQDASGQFGLPGFYLVGGSNGRCVSVVDYSGDGTADIALLVDDWVCYLTQGSSGEFAPPQYLPAVWSHSLAAGDVTGDSRDDFVFTVATNRPDSAIGVYAQDPLGGPSPFTGYAAYDFAEAMVLADVTGDGKQDVVAAHAGWDTLTIFRQTAEGTFGPWEHYPLPYCNYYQPGAMSRGDLNSDGLPDIALADWYNGLVVLLHTAAEEIVDVTPPELRLTPLVTAIAPPNGKTVMVPVEVFGSDEESGIEVMRLQVIDEYGEVEPEMDVTNGTVYVPLVASVRGPDKDGRVYTLILTGTDAAGNTSSTGATVVVTKGNGKK